ncbi:proline--tRNA ligase [Candidatus Dojkabacteria bacterium]|uniref:Proline--tRNA ligase n=1 Tax=Candidatus Dojkabacteria bacterium TaxID=2099670 RepID=A0A955RL42_9BACT|nr:proline--tRNA ligase [Candidatus Dojkabacteria bacterium]
MKYSQLGTKTNKTAKELDSINATLLQKAGFIHQTMAGVYTFLPLGLRVLNKIERIVREEMDKIASEVFMPAIAPTSIWETTGRINTIDVLFKVSPANEISANRSNSEYILNCTHEDLITPIAQQFNQSYKDLPRAYYQIQDKFRNEPRAKSGLMRGREFRMKDLYSFHVSEEDLLRFYHEVAKPRYIDVYKRVGLGESTVIALASGGDFTKEYSHEFQTICESGEDTLFYDSKEDIYYNKEVTASQAPTVQDPNEEMKEMEDVYGENIVGMNDLVDFLKIPANKAFKTLIFKVNNERLVVAALRGDYDVDEHKLKTILNASSLELASEEEVQKLTGASIGYAGVVNLPEDAEVYYDDSTEPLINFECGTNKTNYHTINVNWDRDVKRPETYYDFKIVQEGDSNPNTGVVYETFAASEVGNIFPLNTKFSDAFNYTFVDNDGKTKPVYMGSYGIGTTRLMGVIVEKFNDENGILWPKQVAPFQVHIVHIGNDESIRSQAEKLHTKLEDEGIEVLWDDRDESPGVKLGDADLIGNPIRVVISSRSLKNGGYEVSLRNSSDTEIVTSENVLAWIHERI